MTLLANLRPIFVRRHSQLLLGLALAAGLSSVARAEILNDHQRITWAPGVRGGIPSRTALVNVRSAPYNAKGNGSTDDRAAIQAAIGAAKAGQVVYLPAGTYRVSGGVEILNKGISLRGDGPDKTIIKYDGSGGNTIVRADQWSSYGQKIAVTGGLNKGATVLTLSSTQGISPGTFVIITQDNPPYVHTDGEDGTCTWCGHNDPNHVQTQLAKVTAVSGNSITIERPTYHTLLADHHPTVQTDGLTSGVGIEDLQVWRSNSSATDGDNVQFDTLANSWIRNVRSVNAGQNHISIRNSYACEVRECELLDGFDHGSGHSYGVWLFSVNSEHLIEDNSMYRCRHSMVLEGGGSGCVFGYNYASAGFDDSGDWLSGDMDTHGAHPTMNLFEGNIFTKLAHDRTWGSSSHNTTFRCWITNYSAALKTPSYGRFAVDIQEYNLYENVVGCVIGRPNDTGVLNTVNGQSASTPAAYRLGNPGPSANTSVDPQVAKTATIHGNYDYVVNSAIWSAAISDHTLPASLYLSAKPAWFGSLRWPAFGPDLNPMIGTIPAKVRFDSESH